MTKEELVLKYLDNELSTNERIDVEIMLSDDEDNQQLFEMVKRKRIEILQSIDLLNPCIPQIVPPFHKQDKKQTHRKAYPLKFWHIAAMIALIVGVFFSIRRDLLKIEPSSIDVSSNELIQSKTKYQELDCYISPNRCWNQKQLDWTFIELNR